MNEFLKLLDKDPGEEISGSLFNFSSLTNYYPKETC